jgi:hypothetical protein
MCDLCVLFSFGIVILVRGGDRCPVTGRDGHAGRRLTPLGSPAAIVPPSGARAAVGCAVTPRMRIRRVACSTPASAYMRVPVRVIVSKKSTARIAWAWERRNAAQLVVARCGDGSIPASVRICYTVEAATLTPSTSSSPWMRRYPHDPFSQASRNTNIRIDRSVRGRPRRLGREIRPWRRASRSRCQLTTVSGRTSSRIRCNRLRAAGAAGQQATPDRLG